MRSGSTFTPDSISTSLTATPLGTTDSAYTPPLSTLSTDTLSSAPALETLSEASFTRLFESVEEARKSSLHYQEAIRHKNLLPIYYDVLRTAFPKHPPTMPTPEESLTPGLWSAFSAINQESNPSRIDELQKLKTYASKQIRIFEEALATAKFCLILNEALPFVASIHFPSPPIDPTKFQTPQLCDQIYFIYHYFKTLNVLTEVRAAIDVFLAHLSTDSLLLIKKNITAILKYAENPSTRESLPGIILQRHPTANPDFSDVSPIELIASSIRLGIKELIKARSVSATTPASAQPPQTISDAMFNTRMHHSISAFRLYPSLVPEAYAEMDASTSASFDDRTARRTLQHIIFTSPQLPAPAPRYTNPPRYGFTPPAPAAKVATPWQSFVAVDVANPDNPHGSSPG